MEKTKVSAFDWRLAESRLLYAKYFIDQRGFVDPFDDLWFDLETKELEIGYKPKKGVFLGEIREFRADDSKFQDLYGQLAEEGFFDLEDVDPALYEHPYKRYARKMEIAAAKWEPELWYRLEFFMNADITDGEFFLATNYDWKNYPVFVTTFDAIAPKMSGASPLEASSLTFDELTSMFDPDIYFAKTLYRTSGTIFNRIRAVTESMETLLIKIHLSRGANRVRFARFGEKEDSDYPFDCGTLCDYSKIARNGMRWGEAAIQGAGVLYLMPKLRDKKTDGWERKV